MPADQWLTKNQNDLKWGIVEKIEGLGYVAEIFLSPKGKPSLVAGKAWSALLNPPSSDKAAPRDNVVFEAGYFINAKDKARVLIVRETGAKMPADLGGDIYASLDDKSKIKPIEETVRAFISAL